MAHIAIEKVGKRKSNDRGRAGEKRKKLSEAKLIHLIVNKNTAIAFFLATMDGQMDRVMKVGLQNRISIKITSIELDKRYIIASSSLNE